jgi:ribonuclease HI
MAMGTGAEVIIISRIGEHMEYTIRLHFWATNNVIEYETLIHGLRISSELGAYHLFIREDLELVISQVMKEASCHNSKMTAYYNVVWKIEERFDGLELYHILRRDNIVINSLAKIASSQGPAPLGVFVNDTHEPSVQALWLHDQMTGAADKAKPTLLVEHPRNPKAASPPSLMAIDRAAMDTRSDWTAPFIEYLARGSLPRPNRGMAYSKTLQILHDHRKHPLQVQHLRNSPEMHLIRRRAMTPAGGPCGSLRTSRSAQSVGWEGLSIRLLLGNNGHGHLTNCTKLQGMSVLRVTDTLTHTRATNHPVNVALCDLGA